MTNQRPVPHTVASSLSVFVVLAMTALLAVSVAAQSGRRAPKSSSPAPAPSPESTPVEKKPARETRPEVSFIVGIDRGTTFSNIPTYMYETVLSACAGRLDDSPSVEASIAGRDMHRGEAIKRAKAETESNVVWLQLSSDNGRSQSGDDLRDVGVDYYVFAHTTGKILTSGRTYQGASGGGGIIPIPRPSGRASLPYTEQLLKQAARDAAERILSSMSVSGRKVPT